jgi:hypothetical protein
MSDVIETLKAVYELEMQNRSVPRAANDLPLAYEDITDEWLTNVICRDHSGAAVVSHRLDKVDDGNTSRRRIYLDYNATGQKAGLPPSVFCKASYRFETRLSVGICGAIHNETVFYNKVRPLLDIEAPVGVWANYNPQTFNSIIMLRDLGAGTEFCTLDTDMTEERLRGQMALLARLHGRFYQSDDFDTALADLPTWPEFFGRMLLIGGERLCANGFQAAKEVIPPRLFARVNEVWPATLASAERHKHLPQMLIHSDVHLRNWYIRADGKMGLHDWQTPCKGHWGRDIAYTLTTAMNVETRRRLVKPLLQYYLDRLREEGGPVTGFDEAWNHYRQNLFTALAYWTITMPSPDLPDMQPVETTLEMIRRMAYAIDDYDALESFA